MAQALTSQQIWTLQRSAARASSRATKYQQQKTRLQVDIRHLTRSRDLWKQKFLDLEHATKMAAFFSPRPEAP